MYRDVALAGRCSKRDVRLLLAQHLYPDALSTHEFQKELSLLSDLLSQVLFQEARASGSGLWYKQQLAYLKHVRQRPIFSRDGAVQQASVKPGSLAAPAGGSSFQHACRLQSRTFIARGVVAAYRSKLWAIQAGRRVSLGTVGTERAWRNLQRSSRNKTRTVSDARTRQLLSLTRWLREAQGRLMAKSQVSHLGNDARGNMQLLLHTERFAASMIHGSATDAHLHSISSTNPA